MAYRDRTCHGIQDGPERNRSDEAGWQPARLLVAQPEFGPTGQQGVTVLREPGEPESGGFGWGCHGGGVVCL